MGVATGGSILIIRIAAFRFIIAADPQSEYYLHMNSRYYNSNVLILP